MVMRGAKQRSGVDCVMAPLPPTHSRPEQAGMTEELSFKEVYEEHFRFVWRSLRRLGISESDVADAVQDVFLVVHRRLAEFEGR